MLLATVLSSLLLAVSCVAGQYDLLDVVPEFPDVPVFFVPPQARAQTPAPVSNPSSPPGTAFLIVELFNTLQNLATALVQPLTVVIKPKPSLQLSALPTLAFGVVPTSTPPPPAPKPTGRISFAERIPEGFPTSFYPVPDGFDFI